MGRVAVVNMEKFIKSSAGRGTRHRLRRMQVNLATASAKAMEPRVVAHDPAVFDMLVAQAEAWARRCLKQFDQIKRLSDGFTHEAIMARIEQFGLDGALSKTGVDAGLKEEGFFNFARHPSVDKSQDKLKPTWPIEKVATKL